VNDLLGDEDGQLPYREDAKNMIFEFKHMEPQGLYKANARDWDAYKGLRENAMSDIVGRQCFEVERPSMAFTGGAQLGVAFDKVGHYTWEHLEVELSHRRDTLHSIVMKDFPAILDECYELDFDWSRALKEGVHMRDLYLRLPDRTAAHMAGFNDDGNSKTEMFLENRRYVMAYVRACVMAKQQLSLSFLKLDSDANWADTPGITTAAFQVFKCVSLANKKEGRDTSYKARQGMTVQRTMRAVMDPWLRNLRKRPAPTSLRHYFEMEDEASALDKELPDEEREERFLNRLRMYLKRDSEDLLELQPLRDGPSLLVPGKDTRFAHNKLLLLYDMLEKTKRRVGDFCPREYHEFFMDIFDLSPEQMEYLLHLDDKRLAPGRSRKQLFDRSLYELWNVREMELYQEEYRVRLAEIGVIMDKPMVHDRRDWDKWLREGDHTEEEACTRGALFFRKGNSIRYDIAVRLFTARKAFPHLNGTRSDLLLYPEWFGPNKPHLEGTPDMDYIPQSSLPDHAINNEPTPERRHAALVLQNMQSALALISRRQGTQTLHDILKDHWHEKRVVTYDHARKKIFKHPHFKIAGRKVLQYFTMSLRLPDDNDPVSFVAVGARTIYWMKTLNDNVRAFVVDNEFLRGSRDVAVIIEDLDSVRLLSAIEDEITKDHDEDKALQKRLSDTTLQDLPSLFPPFPL